MFSEMFLFLFTQTEKQIAGRIGDGDIVRAVGGGAGITARSPAGGNGNITVLLQCATRHVLPGNGHCIARTGNVESRHAGYLDDRNQAPKAAGHGVTSAGHGSACVWLADGAAGMVRPASAGTAATGDFMPIYGVTLGIDRKR